MAVTQFGFIGYACISDKMLGIQATSEELDDYAHLMRVVCHVLGLQDR